jgi:hypothetical protein
LRVQIPADASDGRVEVRIRGLSVKSEKAITLLGLPIIDHFEAQSAHAGDQVEVFGYNFDLADVTVNQVAIGGSAAPVVDARALLISP